MGDITNNKKAYFSGYKPKKANIEKLSAYISKKTTKLSSKVNDKPNKRF